MTRSEPLSLTKYAQHLGVSLTVVSRAVRKGRLSKSVVQTPAGPKIGDVELADVEWKANGNHTTTPPSIRERLEATIPGKGAERAPIPGVDAPAYDKTISVPRSVVAPRARSDEDDDIPEINETMTLNEASAIEKRWRAKLVQLEFRKKAEELVEAKDVERQWTSLVTAARAKLLGVPTRVRQKLPHLKPDEVMVIDAFIREALEELAKREEETDE